MDFNNPICCAILAVCFMYTAIEAIKFIGLHLWGNKYVVNIKVWKPGVNYNYTYGIKALYDMDAIGKAFYKLHYDNPKAKVSDILEIKCKEIK